MKKLFASCLAVVMAGAMLAGCGDSDSSSKADTASEAETTTTTTAKEEETTTTTTAKEEETTTTTTEAEPEPAGIAYDPEATESVFEFTDDEADTSAWASPIPCYFDARTFPEDSELTVTVDLKLSPMFVGMMEAGLLTGSEQIGIAPNEINEGWHHFAEVPGTISAGFPIGALLAEMDGYNDGTYMLKPKLNDDGTEKISKNTGKVVFEEDVYMVEDPSKFAPLYCKPDGIIKWDNSWQDWKKDEIHSFTFTISKDQVKKMRDTAIETGYEGLHLQSAGDAIVTKVTFNAGNILTDKQYAEWQESAGEGAVWGA